MSDKKSLPVKSFTGVKIWLLWGVALLLVLFMPGCKGATPTATATEAPINPASVLPGANAITGWKISQEDVTYKHDNLFNLVDGQADSFFAYGFVQASVQRYQDSTGNVINVEIWQLATTDDAYGLFSSVRSGAAANVGNEADSDPGVRLDFWQDHFFVSLNAYQPVPDETLQAVAKTIAGSLPKGGGIPAVVGRLPKSGLVGGSAIFFHLETSVQMQVWLGNKNILGLSQDSNGVVGQYKLGNSTAELVVIEYPNSSQATNGLKALQSSNLPDLVASNAHGNLLGAVFGKVQADQAKTLLEEAIK